MSQINLTKTGIWQANGSGTSTSTTKVRTRANNAYSFTHTDYTVGFVEINNATAKIADTSIEANQFYEI